MRANPPVGNERLVYIYTQHLVCVCVCAHVYTICTVCALSFTGFNVRSFHGSAAIREYFVREYLNITVNGHVHSEWYFMYRTRLLICIV